MQMSGAHGIKFGIYYYYYLQVFIEWGGVRIPVVMQPQAPDARWNSQWNGI
jgi:hypothetical protein